MYFQSARRSVIQPLRPEFLQERSPGPLPARRLFEDPSPNIAYALLSPRSESDTDIRGPLTLSEKALLGTGMASLALASACLPLAFLVSDLGLWGTLFLCEIVSLALKSMILFTEVDEELRQEVPWPRAVLRAALKAFSYAGLFLAVRGRPLPEVQVSMGCLPALQWLAHSQAPHKWLSISLYGGGLLWLIVQDIPSVHYLLLGALGSGYACLSYKLSVRPGCLAAPAMLVLALAFPAGQLGWTVLGVGLLAGCSAVVPLVMLVWGVRFIDRRWMAAAGRGDWAIGMVLVGPAGPAVTLAGIGKVLCG